MLFTLLTDWRQAMKGDEQTRHSGTSHKAAEKFYVIMKDSANSGYETFSSTITAKHFNFQTYEVAGAADSESRIKDIIINIDKNNRNTIELYGVLGTEIAHLKYRHMKAICVNHVSSNDLHDIISCVVCIRNNDMKQYYEHIHGITKYSKDYINFMIRIARMCLLYPKFLYVSVSVSDLKKHLKYIESRMEVDRQFWSLI